MSVLTSSVSRGPERTVHDNLPREHASCPHVGAPIEYQAARVLGRHVRDLPLENAGARVARARRGLRNAEVGELGDAVGADEDVLRREVTVDDVERLAVVVVRLVRSVKACERIEQDAHRDPLRHRLVRRACAPQKAAERVAFDVVHHEKQPERIVADVEHGHDVVMPNRRRELGFLDEQRLELWRLSQVRVRQLERDVTLEATSPTRAREVHRRHSAARDRHEDLVPADEMRHRCLVAGGDVPHRRSSVSPYGQQTVSSCSSCAVGEPDGVPGVHTVPTTVGVYRIESIVSPKVLGSLA
jgi:hypothetical protein